MPRQGGRWFIYFLGSNVALYRLNPELLVHRLKIRWRGSKTWDEVLVRASNISHVTRILRFSF